MEDRYPFFSVIVPTFNRPAQLTHCLQSLVDLDYPRDRFEVIVVDDGSETLAGSIVSSLSNPLSIALITQTHSGPATARNKGAMHAKGEFLAFTDDDCMPAPEWLKALAIRFHRNPGRMIGGRTLNVLVQNPYSTASDLLFRYLYAYCNRRDPDEACFFASNNLALPKDRFHQIGGFDTAFLHAGAEDREFCDRWLHHGFRMTYAPEALIYHTHRLTLQGLCRQQFHYGRGAFHFHQVRARRQSDRLRLEPLSFYSNMLGYALSEVQGLKKYLFLTLILLSQGTNAAGFLWEMLRQIIGNYNPRRSSRRYD